MGKCSQKNKKKIKRRIKALRISCLIEKAYMLQKLTEFDNFFFLLSLRIFYLITMASGNELTRF